MIWYRRLDHHEPLMKRGPASRAGKSGKSSEGSRKTRRCSARPPARRHRSAAAEDCRGAKVSLRGLEEPPEAEASHAQARASFSQRLRRRAEVVGGGGVGGRGADDIEATSVILARALHNSLYLTL